MSISKVSFVPTSASCNKNACVTTHSLKYRDFRMYLLRLFLLKAPNGDMVLEYEYYTFDEENVKFSEQECKQKA
jgi:hypothetical protein